MTGRDKGLVAFSGNFEPQIAGPLDARARVEFLSDLFLPETWLSLDGRSYAYQGMTVTVWGDTDENDGVYFLTDLPSTEMSNWIKTGSGSDSNVFILPEPLFTLENGTSEYDLEMALFGTDDDSVTAPLFNQLIEDATAENTICIRRNVDDNGTVRTIPMKYVVGTTIDYDPSATPDLTIVYEESANTTLSIDYNETKTYKVRIKRNTGTWFFTKEIVKSVYSYSKLFTNADVVDNVLTIKHDMNTESVMVAVYDNLKMVVMPTDITVIDVDNVAVDLSGLTIDNVWNVVIFASGGIAPTQQTQSSYLPLTDKPTLNGIEIVGAKTTKDYNIDIPDNTSDLINDSGFLTSSVETLDNFFNKNEVTALITDLNALKYKVVTVLPTTDISTSTIYLLLVSEGVYQQYMYINSIWEELGTTALDLSDYATIEQLNTKADKETIVNVVVENLEDNHIYNWTLNSNVSIATATGQGYIVVDATAECLIGIPSGHIWAKNQSGILETNTINELMYRNGRWSKIVWSK